MKKEAKYPIKKDGICKINDKKLIKDFVCSKCLNDIKEGERFVLIGTYELKEKVLENLEVGFVSEYFYHLSCWIDYFNEKVVDKLKASQTQALDFMKNSPALQNLIKNASLLKM